MLLQIPKIHCEKTQSCRLFVKSITLSMIRDLNWSCCTDSTLTVGNIPYKLSHIMICTMFADDYKLLQGGMNAVVWTDVLQSILMLSAAATVFISGTISVGGINEVTSALRRGERNTFIKFVLLTTNLKHSIGIESLLYLTLFLIVLRFEGYDISSRIHPITLMFGEFFLFHKYLGFTQTIYQRILSCRNTRQSKKYVRCAKWSPGFIPRKIYTRMLRCCPWHCPQPPLNPPV